MGTSVRDFGSKLRPGNAAFVVFWCVLIFFQILSTRGGDLGSSLLERNGRWDGRPRAGLAARTFHPTAPIGANNLACCLVLAGVFFLCPLWGSWSEKNALWSMAPAWYGSVMATLGKFYVGSMSVLWKR